MWLFTNTQQDIHTHMHMYACMQHTEAVTITQKRAPIEHAGSPGWSLWMLTEKVKRGLF